MIIILIDSNFSRMIEYWRWSGGVVLGRPPPTLNRYSIYLREGGLHLDGAFSSLLFYFTPLSLGG